VIIIGEQYTLQTKEYGIIINEEGIYTPVIVDIDITDNKPVYKVCIIRNLYNNLARLRNAIIIEDVYNISDKDIINLAGENRIFTPIN